MSTEPGLMSAGESGPAAPEQPRVAGAVRWSEAVLTLAGQIAHLGAWELEFTRLASGEFVRSGLRWSDEVYRIFGYAPGAVTMTNELFFEHVHPDDRPRIAAAVDRALAERQPYSIEHRILRADGAERIVLEHGDVVLDDAGQPAKLVGAVQDVTARRKAEKERLELERQMLLTQKMESLGVMAGGIAHDFNNLLMGVLGNLELAVMQLPAGSEAEEFIAQATQAATRAAELTRQILTYSGGGHFTVKPLNLNELVQENVQMLKAAISKRAVLDVHLEPGLPPFMADAGQIQQALMNLTLNAAEAIGAHDGVVRLTTGAGPCDERTLDRNRSDETPPPGWFVWLEVADTGCGMDREMQAKIFDPFFTTKFTGRGLGLAAVMGIVRGHQGAILLDSTPGQGSVFRLLFPAACRE